MAWFFWNTEKGVIEQMCLIMAFCLKVARDDLLNVEVVGWMVRIRGTLFFFCLVGEGVRTEVQEIEFKNPVNCAKQALTC